MVCFNRIVVLVLILCLSRTPLPWGHTHDGMDADQLAIHVRTCHPVTSERGLPRGWHWHLTPIDGIMDHEVSAIVPARSDNSLTLPTLQPAAGGGGTPKLGSGTCCGRFLATARAVRQQKTHLRLKVLLI